jgi:hypothetical protein
MFICTVPNRNTGSCLDLGLPGTVCRERRDRGRGRPRQGQAGPGRPAYWGEEEQLESSRDGGNMMKDNRESIWDVMWKDRWPTE